MTSKIWNEVEHLLILLRFAFLSLSIVHLYFQPIFSIDLLEFFSSIFRSFYLCLRGICFLYKLQIFSLVCHLCFYLIHSIKKNFFLFSDFFSIQHFFFNFSSTKFINFFPLIVLGFKSQFRKFHFLQGQGIICQYLKKYFYRFRFYISTSYLLVV